MNTSLSKDAEKSKGSGSFGRIISYLWPVAIAAGLWFGIEHQIDKKSEETANALETRIVADSTYFAGEISNYKTLFNKALKGKIDTLSIEFEGKTYDVFTGLDKKIDKNTVGLRRVDGTLQAYMKNTNEALTALIGDTTDTERISVKEAMATLRGEMNKKFSQAADNSKAYTDNVATTLRTERDSINTLAGLDKTIARAEEKAAAEKIKYEAEQQALKEAAKFEYIHSEMKEIVGKFNNYKGANKAFSFKWLAESLPNTEKNREYFRDKVLSGYNAENKKNYTIDQLADPKNADALEDVLIYFIDNQPKGRMSEDMQKIKEEKGKDVTHDVSGFKEYLKENN